MTGAFGLEKLLDFGIVLVKPVFVLPRGEAAYFLRSFLENGFQLLPMVLWICFPDWQFLLFLSGLKLLFKLTFPRQVPVGVKLLHLYPSFPDCRLDIESDFGPAQFVVCVAVGTGHNSGMWSVTRVLLAHEGVVQEVLVFGAWVHVSLSISTHKSDSQKSLTYTFSH